ncbi:hypothetical protein Kpho01_12680 [Kitasatospora phosalacinea]|uniref:Uncharacterized protein n=1 Tax=Kitasatospora phosalacinea TaxID=2065 RepID=A0A9W6PE36_9ACTN|nr:hypothetical protein Kpho01_12680 [Kitasatospora phosalacinea]
MNQRATVGPKRFSRVEPMTTARFRGAAVAVMVGRSFLVRPSAAAWVDAVNATEAGTGPASVG